MLDKNGFWMPLKQANQLERPSRSLYVEGWRASHREWISLLLKNRDGLGSPLEKISLSPNGDLSIQTEEFKAVELGIDTALLLEQMQALWLLSKDLPSNLRNKKETVIDLRDPAKPELQLSKFE